MVFLDPHPDKPERANRKSRSIAEPKGAYSSRKGNQINFVLSQFRVFVIKIFSL